MNEDQFIINTAKTRLNEKNRDNIKNLCQNNLNWNKIVEKSSRHEVDSLIYYSLKEHNLTHLVPESVLSSLKTSLYANLLNNSLLLNVINNISEIIQDKIILLKGCDLIQTLYPNIAVRFMSDIDILVEKEKAKEIWNKLRDHGFLIAGHPFKSKLHEDQRLCENLFENNQLPPLLWDTHTVEIHWTISKNVNHHKLSEEAMLGAVPIVPGGNVYRFSTVFSFIHLCIHFLQHLSLSGCYLRHLCDLNEWLTTNGTNENWETIRKLSLEFNIHEIVAIAMSYTFSFFKTDVPSDFLDPTYVSAIQMNLDSLIMPVKGVVTAKPSQSYREKLIRIRTPGNKIIFLLRTAVPTCKWIRKKYNCNTRLGIITAYLKYWSYLFHRHVLRRSLNLGG